MGLNLGKREFLEWDILFNLTERFYVLLCNMSENKILSKIGKLLALAGSSNEHEANLAMEKAMQIAVENNIELSRVSIQQKSQVVKDKLDINAARLSVAHKFVASIIQEYFEVKVVTSGNRQVGRSIYFVGAQDKIDFAKFLNSYLTNSFFNLWHNFYRRNPQVTVSTARESYFLGLYRGLGKKLKEAKEQAEQAIANEAKANYSLVLTNSAKELGEAVEKFFPDIKYSKGSSINVKSDDALNSGFNDGQKINVHAGLKGEKSLTIA